ncbi:ABC transporter permease, partial [Xylella fastidiosa subsp. multiplex]|nr:ABC transporter permease [Xylella fastidiosa subsp. multiplex]
MPADTASPKDDDPGRTNRSERLSALAQQHGALVTLVIAMAVASLSFDTFLTGDNLENMALSSAFLA